MSESSLISKDKSVSLIGECQDLTCPGVSPGSSWPINNKVESSVDFGISELSKNLDASNQEGLESRDDPVRYKKAFKTYLLKTSRQTMEVYLDDGTSFTAPYKHRWENSYRKGILRKLYQAEIWAKRHKLTCGMLSLTSFQTGFTDIEVLDRFREAWSKFVDTLEKMGYLYYKLFEPHKSGVPHLHAMIIGDCSPENIERLERLWHEKYAMGLKDYDFKFSKGLKGNPEVRSLVNYLMKYLSKTILSDILGDPSLVRFHSLFHHTGARMWSCSHYFSYIMRKAKTSFVKVDRILLNDSVIYDSKTSKSFPCKYQTIKGVKYKYELLPFEIKSKVQRVIFDCWVDNYAVRQWFKSMDEAVCLISLGDHPFADLFKNMNEVKI